MGRLWVLVLVAACGFHPSLGGDGSGGDAPFSEAGMGSADAKLIDARVNVDGLIAYYPMEAIDQSVTPDMTGHGHDATCGTCPPVVTGHIGNGFKFDGTTRFDVPDLGNAFDTTMGFTVAMWVNFSALTYMTEDFGCPAGKVEDPTIYNTWELCYDKIHDAWIYDTTKVNGNQPTFETITTFPPPTTGTWYHAAMTWDGHTKVLWIDGIKQDMATANEVVFTPGGMITFGADTDNNGTQSSPFVGTMDDLRIYDHALTTTEIMALAAQ